MVLGCGPNGFEMINGPALWQSGEHRYGLEQTRERTFPQKPNKCRCLQPPLPMAC